jgi:16S rRNA (guanine(966)-N(2))-methyltransferase RsmD
MKNSLSSRVTGGELRGREILSPISDKTHPMGSRERLAILNSIGPNIVDATVLDAYAGTGALGIEALSRGAKNAVFIENNHKTAEILRKNLETLGLKERSTVIEKSVEKAEIEGSFDYIFIDPPYDKINEFDPSVFSELVKSAEKVVLSHPSGFTCDFDGFSKNTKTYAAANVTIFTKDSI